MAELESAIEKSLIDKLCHDKSQWTYRPDIKTEEQLWNNFKYITINRYSYRLFNSLFNTKIIF